MTMIDHFDDYSVTPGIVRNALAVTPDDDTDLPLLPLAFTSRTDGTATVTFDNGETVMLQQLAGSPYPYRIRRIHATGTTATGFVILW